MSYNKFKLSETFQTKMHNSQEKENINTKSNKKIKLDNESGFVLFGEDTEDDVKSNYSNVIINDVIKNWEDHVVRIKSDGNCLFRSLSYCLYKKENEFNYIRNVIVYHVMKKWEFYMNYIVGNEELDDIQSKEDYVKYMSKTGTYGGNIELVAASRIFIININVFSKDGSYFITNVQDRAKPTVSLFYEGDGYHGHYNVISIDINQEQWNLPIKQVESISADEKNEITCENCVEFFWKNGRIFKSCHHEQKFKLPNVSSYLSELERLFSDGKLTESNYNHNCKVSLLIYLLKRLLLASGLDVLFVIYIESTNIQIRLSRLEVKFIKLMDLKRSEESEE